MNNILIKTGTRNHDVLTFFKSVKWLPHDHLYGSLWPRICFGCSSGWPFCLSQWTLLHLFAFPSLTSPTPDSDAPQGSNSGPLLFSSCRGLTQCPTLNTISLKWLPHWHLQLCPHPWMPTVYLTSAFERGIGNSNSTSPKMSSWCSPTSLLLLQPAPSQSMATRTLQERGPQALWKQFFSKSCWLYPVNIVHRFYHCLGLCVVTSSPLVFRKGLPSWPPFSPLRIRQPECGCYRSDHDTLFTPLQKLPTSGPVKAKVLHNMRHRALPCCLPSTTSLVLFQCPCSPDSGPLHLLLPWITLTCFIQIAADGEALPAILGNRNSSSRRMALSGDLCSSLRGLGNSFYTLSPPSLEPGLHEVRRWLDLLLTDGSLALSKCWPDERRTEFYLFPFSHSKHSGQPCSKSLNKDILKPQCEPRSSDWKPILFVLRHAI